MAERTKQKRERKNYTEEEKATLLSVFAVKEYPDSEECERLGHSMGRTRNQIQNFFDNQRKKKRAEAKAAANAAAAEGPVEAQAPAADNANQAPTAGQSAAAAAGTVPMIGPVVASSQQSNTNQQQAAVPGLSAANAENGQASQQSYLYQQQAAGAINTVPGFYSPTNYVGVNGFQQQAPSQFAVDAARQYHQGSQLSANVVHFGNAPTVPMMAPTVQIPPTVQMVANVPMSIASFNSAMTPNVPMSIASFNSAPSNNSAHTPIRPGSSTMSMPAPSPKPEPYCESFLAAMLDDSWLNGTKPVTRAWLEDMVINNPHAMIHPAQHIDNTLMGDNYVIAHL